MDGAARVCPACGGPLSPWRTVESSEVGLGPASLDLARCVRCGSAVTLGAPVAEAHRAGAYGGGRPRAARLATPLLTRFDRQRLGLIGPARSPGGPRRLVDAGAGRGRFVAAARAAGFDAVGIEPSLRAVDPTLGLIPATIEAAGLASGSVDVVTLWHVLEHLDDPGMALAAIWDWLVPGGLLLVGVPNLSSWQARLTGGRWYHLDMPRHRVHYTVAGVTALLGAAGFEVVEVEHRLLEQNPYGMWQSLVSLGTRRISYLYNLLKRNAPLESADLLLTVAALPWLPVAVAFERLAARRGAGGTVAVLARRV
ncbi:MAG TPA: class I SAM-dependent methyltransferase [Solirubrobacteraceae bacterium]|nr:class I SAM-dependent methyltransferase [Solirubrobacteraceae bacterium]